MLEDSSFYSKPTVVSHNHTALNMSVGGCELRANSWKI